MSELTRLASDHQEKLAATSDQAARRVLRAWNRTRGGDLDAGWDAVAPEVESIITRAQITAAKQAPAYVAEASALLGAAAVAPRLVPDAFGGATREGRQVGPEMYAGVTTTKTLIGRGVGVGQAFRAGAMYMAVMAKTLVRDAGRSADMTAGVARGARYSVRVVQPGACSRCAILAGVKGYRANFLRHPGCRCTSMPLFDDEAPEGFYRSPSEYFESLSEAEQARVFTKAGAEAIRLGADPAKVVNARRGMFTAQVRGSQGLIPVRATSEGGTARGSWGRQQVLDVRGANDRYRRTSRLRLMPEQIIHQATSPTNARELLQRYGYLY